jgi:hypothetical protein
MIPIRADNKRAWKGRYRIEGPAFIYSDEDTGRVAISGGGAGPRQCGSRRRAV